MNGKKRFLLFALVAVFTVSVLSAPSHSASSENPANDSVIATILSGNGATWLDANTYKAFTIGNHSYITLSSCDDPGSGRSLFDSSGVYPPHYIISAFEALADFEKAHPELHVVRWDMEINRPSHYNPSSDKLSEQLSCLRGIIIDHEPRK